MPILSRLSQRTVEAPISYLMREALNRPELISLAAGFVDQGSLPVEKTSRAVAGLLESPERGYATLQYSSTMGDSTVRDILLKRLVQADGLVGDSKSVEQVIMTAGSNELLYQLGLVLLDPDDVVLCAAPTYFVFLGALQGIGARAHGLPVDENGIIADALEACLKKTIEKGDAQRVKALYLTTYFDNPSSITTSRKRREEIFEIISRHNRQHSWVYIIEDAAYRDLRYFGEDIPSLSSLDIENSTVIYTSSFSKSFSPGLRVGWGVLPKDLVAPLSHHQGNMNFGAPHFSQQVIRQVIETGDFDLHLSKLRLTYRGKLETMVSAAEKYFENIAEVSWLPAAGGLYIWLRLRGIDTGPDGPLFPRALEKGVLYVPGCYCYPVEGCPQAHDHIRLSFGVQPPERIEHGMQLLADAIRETLALNEPQYQ